MNAGQARRLVLVRSFEEAAGKDADAAAPSWTRADAHWADSEALRRVGESASPSAWLVERGELASGRLLEREPVLGWLLRPGRWRSGRAFIIITLAALAGALASSLLAPPDRINLLAPPLLALLLWNLLVYAWLIVRLLGSRRDRPAGSGLLHRLIAWTLQHLGARRRAAASSEPAQRFALAWARASQPLQHARIAAVLHLAALALAGGAVLALYLRGLVFEFAAGWDSTFLDAQAVRIWLSVVLGPALALTGQVLPDAAQLDALRFSRGGAEPAARWIHLYALTAALVLLPRALLALTAIARGMRLERAFPLPLDDPYYQRRLQWLAHARDLPGRRVVLLPYGYRVDAAHQAALATLLEHEFGRGLTIEQRPTIPAGAEDDDLDSLAPSGSGAGLLVALFALTATPERETHGEFLRRLGAHCAAPASSCRVMIDESGYRTRLAVGDRERRVDERRRAWTRLLADVGAGEPWFVDLNDASLAPARATDAARR